MPSHNDSQYVPLRRLVGERNPRSIGLNISNYWNHTDGLTITSTGALETNARWRWEFEPGSHVFVVYTDGRDTTGRGFSRLVSRGLAIKLTRFIRF